VENKIFGGVRNSADLLRKSLPRLRLGHITADKRLRYAPPKLPSATSLIRKTLSAIESGEKANIKV